MAQKLSNWQTIPEIFKAFLVEVRNGNCNKLSFSEVEEFLYIEDALKFEFGYYLREKGFNVQFERNITAFGLDKSKYLKKEIDLVIKDINDYKCIIEFKFPLESQGETTNHVRDMLNDIFFVSQLKGEFTEGFAITMTNDCKYYCNPIVTTNKGRKQLAQNQSGYNYFRNGITSNATPSKIVSWKEFKLPYKYYIFEA